MISFYIAAFVTSSHIDISSNGLNLKVYNNVTRLNVVKQSFSTIYVGIIRPAQCVSSQMTLDDITG